MNLDNFLKGKNVINCVTDVEAHRFMAWIHENTGEQWRGDIWDHHGKNTCYNINSHNDVRWAYIEYYTNNNMAIISLDEFFNMVGHKQIEKIGAGKSPKIYGIRNKETGKMFKGRKGCQTFWEKPGAIKVSFYGRNGVSFNNQQEWELVTYNLVEEII